MRTFGTLFLLLSLSLSMPVGLSPARAAESSDPTFSQRVSSVLHVCAQRIKGLRQVRTRTLMIGVAGVALVLPVAIPPAQRAYEAWQARRAFHELLPNVSNIGPNGPQTQVADVDRFREQLLSSGSAYRHMVHEWEKHFDPTTLSAGTSIDDVRWGLASNIMSIVSAGRHLRAKAIPAHPTWSVAEVYRVLYQPEKISPIRREQFDLDAGFFAHEAAQRLVLDKTNASSAFFFLSEQSVIARLYGMVGTNGEAAGIFLTGKNIDLSAGPQTRLGYRALLRVRSDAVDEQTRELREKYQEWAQRYPTHAQILDQDFESIDALRGKTVDHATQWAQGVIDALNGFASHLQSEPGRWEFLSPK